MSVFFRTVGFILALTVALPPTMAASQGLPPPGITVPQVLPLFTADQKSCAAPPDVSRSLRFVQDNRREFIEGVGLGLSAAAADRNMQYSAVVAADDPQNMIAQVQAAADDKQGAIIVAPVDPRSLAPSLQSAIANGIYVGAVVPPPAVTILNAPQYLVGKTIAEDAARYITEELGGRAKVVLLTHDSLQFLAPRFTAMRDILGSMPGVTIVADISPSPVNEDGGYATMNTILLAQPDIDVVLGADTVVLGALRAIREAGRDRADQYFGGIDGEPDAIAEISDGNGPFKATVSLASPVFGYALGQFAADWLEGKVVPQAMDILPSLLTADNIATYERDIADPATVWADLKKRAEYLRMYGSICYDTRDQYLNFPWSSEAAPS